MIRVIAELGTSHEGDFDKAIAMQSAAADAGCWAVKLQIRTDMEECTPEHLWSTTREFRGETLPYLEYRRMVEFDDKSLTLLMHHARMLDLEWFASVWDVPSVERLSYLSRDYVKIPSAMATNEELLRAIDAAKFGKVFLSAGMTHDVDVQRATCILAGNNIVLMHCVAAYHCPDNLCNLKRLSAWKYPDDDPQSWHTASAYGYSGHERGILPSLIAVGLGATFIERHLTLDKSNPGSDQACSLEPHEMAELVQKCHEVEAMLGTGAEFPLPEEIPAMRRLRPEKLLTDAIAMP